MEDLNPLVVDLVDLLDPELRNDFLDQIAVIEHIAETPRVLAECLALLALLHKHPGALSGVTCIEYELAGQRRWLLTRELAAARQLLAAKCVAHSRIVDAHAVLWTEFDGVAVLAPFE